MHSCNLADRLLHPKPGTQLSILSFFNVYMPELPDRDAHQARPMMRGRQSLINQTILLHVVDL